VPLPALKTECGPGFGMAACPTLGLLVTADSAKNTLSVFTLPRSSGAGAGANAGAGVGTSAGLARVCTLGGGWFGKMKFKFVDGNDSGCMAFTGPATSRLLLVTDRGHDAVHVIDVVGRVHVGYVGAPGTIAGPWGVAARGSLVAVSAWAEDNIGDHVVRVFEGSGAMWTAVRVVAGGFRGPGSADGQLQSPRGLRFTVDGTGLVVADAGNGRACMFRMEDGSFVRHVATGLSDPWDVEECEGGWLVACTGSDNIQFVSGGVDCSGGGSGGSGSGSDGSGGGVTSLGKYGSGDGKFRTPSALALVPGVGLVVREMAGQRLQFFASLDITVAGGWMVGVVPGAF
jgi:hypothetical protein